MKINLNSYIELISDFLTKKISARCFEYAYLAIFYKEQGKRAEKESSILTTLFLDVDEFCSDLELIDEHDIGENELRCRCDVALERLKLLPKFTQARTGIVKVKVNAYKELLVDYLYGNISTKCFKYIYNKFFTEEIGERMNEEYSVLQSFFKVLREGNNENILKASCKEVLKKLSKL